MGDADAIVGCSDVRRDPDGVMRGTAHYADGRTERRPVAVEVSREHRDSDGNLKASGVVARA